MKKLLFIILISFISLYPSNSNAKACKLGSGDCLNGSLENTLSIKACSSSSQCSNRQKCQDGHCIDACINSTCSQGCKVVDHEAVCVECTSSRNCSKTSGKSLCDTTHNTCVECLKNSDCKSNEFCESGTYVCKPKKCKVANCNKCDTDINTCDECKDGFLNEGTSCTECNAYDLTLEHGSCSTCLYQSGIKICTLAQCDTGYSWDEAKGKCIKPTCDTGFFFKEGEGCVPSCPTIGPNLSNWELCEKGCCYKIDAKPRYQKYYSGSGTPYYKVVE